ncbi:MAG: DUF4760 domain-containing protein [Candidatus Thorarchaeota archaeon]
MVTFETVLDVLPIVSLVIVLSYYSLQIRNQNISRKAQLYMQLFNVETSREFHEGEIDVNSLDVSDLEEVHNKILSDRQLLLSFRTIMFRADGTGTMLKSGLLDPEMIFHFGYGIGPISTWQRWKPYIEWTRERWNAPDYLAGFEYYANEMIRLRRERGYSTEWSDEEGRWL